ncbi:MAG: M3 family oligoendopeptidase [Acidobacteriota bacterium]
MITTEQNQLPPSALESKGWDLSELLPDSSEETVRQRLLALEEGTQALEQLREELHAEMAPEVLLDFLRQYEALTEAMVRVEAYGHLWFSSNTQSADALTWRNRVGQTLTQLDNRLIFFTLWWQALNDSDAQRLLPVEDEHSDYRRYLEDLRRFRPHTLEERSEQVINIKDADGIGGIVTLYSMLTNRLEFQLEVDGEIQTMNRDRLMSFVYSRDPEMRATAYRELYRVYSGESTILAQIYTYRVRDWHNEHVELRGYSEPIAVRNLYNDVSGEAVQTLLEVTQEHRGLFQRFFRLKARMLGLETLRRYDIYAPVGEPSRDIPWPEAVSEVLDTFHAFHPRIGQLASRVFEDDHFDSEIRHGKRGGAFCSTVLPSLTPWVLVNYTGRPRDVASVAHELGHAVHSMLAQHHSIFTQHPSLPLAETASVFAEMLVTERLLDRERDPAMRRELLSAAISDIYATVMRQAYFVRFELDAHRAILEGRSLDHLNELYLENLREQFGGAVEVSDEFRHEWTSISHIFHTPFYCYAYSFGQLLVLALYRRYQEQGEAFKPGYLRLLSYGGSAEPEAVLREAGIDIHDRDFWRGGFEVVEDMIGQLEQLQS